MRSKSKSAFVVTAFVWIAAAFVFPGCYSIPLPSSRKPFAERRERDYSASKVAKLSRSELIQKLGEPDYYSTDLRVACYRVNEITAKKLWIFLVIPVGTDKSSGGSDTAFVEFDEQDRVKRSAIKRTKYPLSDEVRDWLAGKKDNIPKPPKQ